MLAVALVTLLFLGDGCAASSEAGSSAIDAPSEGGVVTADAVDVPLASSTEADLAAFRTGDAFFDQVMRDADGLGPLFFRTAFPVGTIIVKEIESDDLHKIFAMTKRGGNYNVKGPLGWEWFELEGLGRGPTILWHGVGPADGKTYGGDPNNGCNGCNGCHGAAADNDGVLSEALQLSAL